MATYLTHTSWLPSATTDSGHNILDLESTDLNTATIISLMDRRERMIESYLATRYDVPFTQSSMITKIGEDFVTYDIYNLLLNKDSGLVEQPIVEHNYNLSKDVLSDLQTGMAKLLDNSGNRIPERNLTNRVYTNTRDYEPTFDVGNPLKWRVSIDRQNDLNDARGADY